jgi:hypothetical protein
VNEQVAPSECRLPAAIDAVLNGSLGRETIEGGRGGWALSGKWGAQVRSVGQGCDGAAVPAQKLYISAASIGLNVGSATG